MKPDPKSGSPISSGLAAAQAAPDVLRWLRLILLMAVGALVGAFIVLYAEAATTTIPERAVSLCGSNPCFAHGLPAPRRRLTIFEQGGVIRATLTSRKTAVVAAGQICSGCGMPTAEQLADPGLIVQGLIYQQPSAEFAAQVVCPDPTEHPAIWRVYENTIISRVGLFQADVRIGCFHNAG